MFHIKKSIPANLILAFLLSATTSYAEEGTSQLPASPQPTSPQQNTAAPVANPVASLDESPEAVKLRSGIGDPIAGKGKSLLCQGCHGEDGNSFDPMIPHLSGQYGRFITKQIRNFQSGVRVHQIMSPIAATISNNDLADISAYFGSQVKMKGDGSEGNPRGKDLFLNGDMSRMVVGCVNCHGVNGKGKTPKNAVFPVIGGQNKNYLQGQLVNFRGGVRANSPGGVMSIIAQKMTDEEIEALSDYISRL